MKKFLIILGLLLLTGCSKEKELNCEMKDEYDDMIMIQSMKVTYNENSIKKANLSILYQVDDEKLMDTVKKSSKESFNEYEGLEGITFNEEIKKLEYKYIMNIEINKVSSTVRSNLGILSDDIVKIQDSLQANGYVCK